MAKPPISKTARSLIEAAVDALFERAKGRLLGPQAGRRTSLGGKALKFSFIPDLTLGALFTAGSREEGVHKPDHDLMAGLMSITEKYLDAQKEKTKAQVVQSVQSFLQDASSRGVNTDVQTVLGGQLADLWGKVHSDVRKIVETESTVARNMGVDDAIQRISAMQGVDDPIVYFVIVRDSSTCKECKKIHLLDDEITPKVWKRSEVTSGYHKKGSLFPSVGGIHPHCRCVMSVLMPGFGFNDSGMVVWKSRDWNQLERQKS